MCHMRRRIHAVRNRLLRMCAHLGRYSEFGNFLLPAYLVFLTPYLSPA